MCLIVFAWHPKTPQPLLVAANRDEFHQRAAAPMHWWEDDPTILAGRDLEAGGTWLGVSRSGRFAAVTNIRDPDAGDTPAPRSRGDLTREFLAGNTSAERYVDTVFGRRGEYLGFNLLVSDGSALWYLHGSRGKSAEARALGRGVYGLSNAALDVPWPKVERGKARMTALLNSGEVPSHKRLRSVVNDPQLADDSALAGHGLDGEMARQLSAQFIVTPSYGTRCCSTLFRDASGALQLAEQRYSSAGEVTGEDAFAIGTGIN